MYEIRERWRIFRELFKPEIRSVGSIRTSDVAEIVGAFDRGTPAVIEAWNIARAMVMRGASAGAIAGLTVAGSQLVAGPTRLGASVFWTFLLFFSSLSALGARQLLVIRHAQIRRTAEGLLELVGEAAFPAPILSRAARWCDKASVVLLILGCISGIMVLYSLTH